MRIIKKISSLLIIICLGSSHSLKSQNITLSGDIYEYATYYVNSFDLNTGATNVQVFRYQLSSDYYPVQLKVNFTASMRSPALGINNELTIIEVITANFFGCI